ncbi:alkaline phosphatase family protein [Aquimarina algiphila]|uniref:alkaline phosphatase family protein n=1 Tax=Aquimarina algiphila TaxID=2047982 RepID=UPI00248FE536|nr:alkaline phosphatase family protein [Aquimarina algiphila]
MKLRIYTSALYCFLLILNGIDTFGQNTKQKTKVVLISVDGAADWILDDLLKHKILPENGAFSKMKKKGAYAQNMTPVSISATAVSHISLFTGVHPNIHGVVGNNILMPGEEIKSPRATSGFLASLEAETIWNAAMRQGKNITNINAVGQDDSSPDRRGTRTFGYGKKMANSIVSDLTISQANKDMYLEGFEYINKLSPKTRAFFKLFKGGEVPVYYFIADSTFDGITNYDTILVDLDENLDNGYIGKLKANNWSEVSFKVAGQKVSSWSYIMDLNPRTGESKTYLGAIGFNPSSPDTFKEKMEKEVGIWPCEQDNIKLNKGLITEQMWFDQAERLAKYYQKLILSNINENNWDLLSGYFTLIDDVQHRFLLKDERQLDYAMENGNRRKRYENYIVWAYQTIDSLLNELMQAAPKDVNFIIVSDHGVAPIHSIVLINKLLEDNGVSVKGDEIEARAYSTGPAAHIYVNVKGRQKNGVVPQEELSKYIENIVKICKELNDPITGLPIFQTVLKTAELKKLQIEHPNRSGDVFVSAKIGWSVSSKLVSGIPSIVPNSFNKDAYAHLDKNVQQFLSSGFMNETGLGVHGNLGIRRKMHAIFYAFGPNIPNKNVGSISALDVTPTVAELLKITPPKKANGIDVFENH